MEVANASFAPAASMVSQQQHEDDLYLERESLLLSLLSEEDDDDEDGDEWSIEQDSEASSNEMARRDAMDTIEEAWEDGTDTLNLHLVCLDRLAIGLLLHKWEQLCLQRHSQGITINNNRKTIRRIVLDRCWFRGGFAVHLMVILLNQIGDELKELVLTDADRPVNPRSSEQPLVAMLGGLQKIELLESLVVERANLCGQIHGYHLRLLLARNPNLEVLQLFACHIDDAMYDELLLGLRDHYELRYLDVGECNLNDQQLSRLVDALVYGASQKKLQLLDLSGSAIGGDSFQYLARLLYQCFQLEELILCSCHDLTSSVEDASTQFKDFETAIQSISSWKHLRLGHVDLTSPLLRALEANEDLQIDYHSVDVDILNEDDDISCASSSSASTRAADPPTKPCSSKTQPDTVISDATCSIGGLCFWMKPI